MFGRIKNKTKSDDHSHVTDNSIMVGTVVIGDITTDGNIRIDGTIKGSVNAKGRVVLGQNGVIEGEIICQNASISGTLKTKIIVSELLTLKSTANVLGDIITNRLEVESGAEFNGNCFMDSSVKLKKNEKNNNSLLTES